MAIISVRLDRVVSNPRFVYYRDYGRTFIYTDRRIPKSECHGNRQCRTEREPLAAPAPVPEAVTV